MRTTIKDFICALFIAAILILLFSTNYLPTNIPPSDHGMPQHLGNSGIVVQGNGAEPADTILTESHIDVKNKTTKTKKPSKVSNSNEITNEENKEFNIDTTKEDEDNMNEMLLTFWHGVAAVLIGEASALLVAAAWMKICKNNNKISKE